MKASLTSFGAPANFRRGYYVFQLHATYREDSGAETRIHVGTRTCWTGSHSTLKGHHTRLLNELMADWPTAAAWEVSGQLIGQGERDDQA